MSRLLWVGVLAALLGPLGSPGSVRRGLITFGFTGEVTEVFDPSGLFNGTYAVGQTVTGTYTFNTTPDDVFDVPEGRYHVWFQTGGQPVDFRLQAGGRRVGATNGRQGE